MTTAMQLAESAPFSRWIGPVTSDEPSSDDLTRAISTCNFAVVVWDTPDGRIRVANQAAAALFGLPLDAVPGRKMADIFGPRDKVDSVVAAFSSRAVDNTRTDRHIRTANGTFRDVRVWSRTIELAETRVVVSLFVPSNEVARLGQDPSAPWRDLAPVAVGFTDGTWRIVQVSRDIEEIIGTSSEDLIGVSLLDLIHPDDAADLRGADGAVPEVATTRTQLRFQDSKDSWVKACLLMAPTYENAQSRLAFAVIGPPAFSVGTAKDRVATLESRLRNIYAEVRAAGLLDEIKAMPHQEEFPELAQLTSRQWEILIRLMAGERVSSVARDLFISQSTVRNHLSAIFQLFDVHSQAELLELLRGGPQKP